MQGAEKETHLRRDDQEASLSRWVLSRDRNDVKEEKVKTKNVSWQDEQHV